MRKNFFESAVYLVQEYFSPFEPKKLASKDYLLRIANYSIEAEADVRNAVNWVSNQ